MTDYIEAPFAQLEHINQILHNNIDYEGWIYFDTHLLLEQSPKYGTYNSSDPKSSKITKNVKDVRYDSIIVNVDTTSVSNAYVYTFEVRNQLWDGNYRYMHSKNNDSDDDVAFAGTVQAVKVDSNTLSLTVGGANHQDLRIYFHMTMQGTVRTIAQNSMQIETDDKYTDDYSVTEKHSGYVFDEKHEPIKGANVSLVGCGKDGFETSGGLKSHLNTKTDANGKFTLNYSDVPQPGTYYAKLTATYGQLSITKIVEVEKTMNDTRGVEWGDLNQYKDVLKGSIKEYTIKILAYDRWGKHPTDERNRDSTLKGQSVTVTFINPVSKREVSQTCIIDSTNTIKPKISYRKFYEDTSYLRISMTKTEVYDALTSTMTVKHIYATANSLSQVKSYVDSSSGPDWVMLRTGEYKATSSIPQLNITRDMVLMGVKGNNEVSFNGDNKYSMIKVSNPSPSSDNFVNFKLIGVTMRNCNPAITSEKATAVRVDRCIFTNNKNPSKHHQGCCIYRDITDANIKDHALYQLGVYNSYFYNNIGNEIVALGRTIIMRNLFRTNEANCLKQPEPKVVLVVAGDTLYMFNKSHIKITQQYTSNHCYAKALAYVYKNGRFNGRGPSQLGRDNSLPLFGHWGNQAYTYAIYYYPHGINAVIVCSPKRGFERKATGHASSKKNWVFYDGYDFIRRSNGKGNTRDPWTSDELAIPVNIGVYDIDLHQFTEMDYNPVMSYFRGDDETDFLPGVWK